MARPIRLWVYESDGEVVAVPASALEAAGMTEDDETQTLLPGGSWHTITLKPLLYGLEEEIEQAMLETRPKAGFVSNLALYQAARFESVVKEWQGKYFDGKPVDRKTLPLLPLGLMQAINTELDQRMNPNIRWAQDFTNSSKLRPQGSGETPTR